VPASEAGEQGRDAASAVESVHRLNAAFGLRYNHIFPPRGGYHVLYRLSGHKRHVAAENEDIVGIRGKQCGNDPGQRARQRQDVLDDARIEPTAGSMKARHNHDVGKYPLRRLIDMRYKGFAGQKEGRLVAPHPFALAPGYDGGRDAHNSIFNALFRPQ